MKDPLDEKDRLIILLVVALGNERAKLLTVAGCKDLTERIYAEQAAIAQDSSIELGVVSKF